MSERTCIFAKLAEHAEPDYVQQVEEEPAELPVRKRNLLSFGIQKSCWMSPRSVTTEHERGTSGEDEGQ